MTATPSTPVRAATDRSNGNGHKLQWWLVGLLASIVISGVATSLGLLKARVDEIDSLQRARGERITGVAERVAVVESSVTGHRQALEAELAALRKQLDRIERQLDGLISRGGR